MATLCNNILELTNHELETAIFSEPKKFFLFSNYQQESNSLDQQKISITDQNTLTIANQKYQLTLDLQEFKEFVDKILPAHLIYKILLNKNVIAAKALDSERYIDSTCLANIDNIADLSAYLSIDKNSDYYQKINDKFYKKYFIALGFIVILNILYLIGYFLIKNKFQHLQYKNYSLIQYIEIANKLENIFLNSENILKNQNTEINILELADDLENYFNINQANIKIKTKVKTQHIFIPSRKKDFYQLLFSLTNLLIAFMNGQSKQQKSIVVSLDAEQIVFEFESFALDEEKMIYLANNVLRLPKSFFLLNCASLFQLLKDYGFEYNIEILGEYNHRFAINLLNKKPQDKNSKILKFRSVKDA